MNGYVSSISAKIAAISPEVKSKLLSLTTGWGIWVAYNWWFDNALYPVVVARWGGILGGIIMFGPTLLNNFVWLFVYVYKNMKWVGDSQDAIETMFKWTRRIIAHEYKYIFVKYLMCIIFAIPHIAFTVTLWCTRRGGFRAFLALSMFTDSFVVAVYFRNENSKGISARDLRIFVASTVVSCAYWTLRSWILVIIIKIIMAMLQYVQKLFF